MAFLFRKFQEAVNTLAKSPTFARDPRHLQFEADVNRLFLYTSYKRLGQNAIEEDAEEIIEMATTASVAEQQKQVQENIHLQIKHISEVMDSILRPDTSTGKASLPSDLQNQPRRSGLSFAVGGVAPLSSQPAIAPTRPLSRSELSQNLMGNIGYTLDVKQSLIPHREAGNGLFLSGEADIGSVVAFYPGIIYSPAFYKYIPGYPRIDSSNSYLITRYDNLVINAQPWGVGGETRQLWDGSEQLNYNPDLLKDKEAHSDRFWRMLARPVEKGHTANSGEVLERRNPLACGHFANHPPDGSEPNVMVCPYDFPLSEKDMRVYIPNIMFGGEQPITMKRFGSFWFRTGGSSDQEDSPVIKTLVLVTTRAVCHEELYLNYRLSNAKKRPEWYVPIDEEEDKRRWG